jgi:uroporphyrinogen decarboxylase
LPEGAALIGFAGAPWTVATYMIEGGASRDYRNARGWAYRRPDEFQRLMDLLIQATADYLIAQVERGAEAVQLFDSWAGVLPPAQFRQWSIRPIREITQRLKEKFPDIPVIGFPRGAGLLYEEFARETSVDCVSIDGNIAPGWARDNLQTQCCVQGNLDNLVLIEGGDLLDAETNQILQALIGGPFIFNLGHGILPETPPEHVERLVRRVRAGTPL